MAFVLFASDEAKEERNFLRMVRTCFRGARHQVLTACLGKGLALGCAGTCPGKGVLSRVWVLCRLLRRERSSGEGADLGALLDLLLWAPAEQSHGHSPTLATRFLRLWVQKRVKSLIKEMNIHFSLVLSFCLVLSPLKCP